MNVNDFIVEYATEIVTAESEYSDIFRNRAIITQKVEIQNSLRHKRRTSMSDLLFKKSVDMMSEFLEICNDELEIPINSIDYDPFIEDSIAIYYPGRKARINLYFNEDCPVNEDNFEEVYFSFEYENERHLVNDTMDNIVPFIKYILSR